MISFKQFKENQAEDPYGVNGNPFALKESPEVKQHHEDLKSKYNFTPDDAYYIQNYTNESQHLNTYLHNKHSDPYHENKQQHEFDSKMLSASISGHPAPHDIDVYSGIKGDPRKKMNSKGIVHHPGFISASLNPHVATSFALGHKTHEPYMSDHEHKIIYQIHSLHIKIPKGSYHGAYVGGVSPATTEREFIINKGKNLKINHTEVMPKQLINGDHIIHHIHHANIVSNYRRL